MSGLRRILAAKKAGPPVEVKKVTRIQTGPGPICQYYIYLKSASTGIVLSYTLYNADGRSVISRSGLDVTLSVQPAAGVYLIDLGKTIPAVTAKLTIQITVGGKTTTVEYSGEIIEEIGIT